MPPDSRVAVGVAGWVERRSHLLMIQRGGTEGLASDGHGLWSVPGGWMDYGETIENAAAREVEEETGAVVEPPFGKMGVVQCQHDSAPLTIVTIFVKLGWSKESPEPWVTEPDKCPVVEWVPLLGVVNRPLFAPLAKWLGVEPG